MRSWCFPRLPNVAEERRARDLQHGTDLSDRVLRVLIEMPGQGNLPISGFSWSAADASSGPSGGESSQGSLPDQVTFKFSQCPHQMENQLATWCGCINVLCPYLINTSDAYMGCQRWPMKPVVWTRNMIDKQLLKEKPLSCALFWSNFLSHGAKTRWTNMTNALNKALVAFKQVIFLG